MTFGDTDKKYTTRPERVRITKKFNKNFWEWFGWSQIVNPEDGSPRVVYHGTSTDELFTAFNVPDLELGIHVGTRDQAAKFVSSDEDFFSDDVPEEVTAGRIYPLYASIRNPLRLDDTSSWYAHKLYAPNYGSRDKLIAAGVFPDTKHMDEYLAAHTRARSKKVRAMSAYMKQYDAGLRTTPNWEVNNAENEWLTLQHREIIFLRNLLQSKGYDGIVYLNRHEGRYSDEPSLNGLGSNADVFVELLKKWQAEDNDSGTKTKSKKKKNKKKKNPPKIVSEDSYIVWNPGQLKSALGNRGTWDLNDPDILHGVTAFGGLRSR